MAAGACYLRDGLLRSERRLLLLASSQRRVQDDRSGRRCGKTYRGCHQTFLPGAMRAASGRFSKAFNRRGASATVSLRRRRHSPVIHPHAVIGARYFDLRSAFSSRPASHPPLINSSISRDAEPAVLRLRVWRGAIALEGIQASAWLLMAPARLAGKRNVQITEESSYEKQRGSYSPAA
jgi:hypothetical protein